jgi:anti-sigma B factor antagonist
MRHAYQGEAGRPIHVVVDATPDQVCVWLYHYGRDFDPSSVKPPVLDGSQLGGYGVYLIKQSVDDVHYFRDADGRCGVRLFKRRTTVPTEERSMQTTVEKIGDVAVVTLNTEQLDTSNTDEFKREMESVLNENHKVVLNLSRVQFVDSNGCAAILSCLKQITKSGGDLRLCQVNDPVRTVFGLIRLHRICEILDTEQEAVRAFQK